MYGDGLSDKLPASWSSDLQARGIQMVSLPPASQVPVAGTADATENNSDANNGNNNSGHAAQSESHGVPSSTLRSAVAAVRGPMAIAPTEQSHEYDASDPHADPQYG